MDSAGGDGVLGQGSAGGAVQGAGGDGGEEEGGDGQAGVGGLVGGEVRVGLVGGGWGGEQGGTICSWRKWGFFASGREARSQRLS